MSKVVAGLAFEKREMASLRSKINQLSNSRTKRAIVQMSQPAKHLAMSLVSGHVTRGLSPKILDGSGVPTQPVTVRGSFEVTIGTGGVGWVALCPKLIAGVDSVQYTGPTFTGTTLTANRGAAAVVGVSSLALGSPYTKVQYEANAAGLQARMVSMSLTARYAGTLLNKSGSVYCYSEPTSADLSNVPATTFMNQMGCVKYAVNEHDEFHLTVSGTQRFHKDLQASNANPSGAAFQQIIGLGDTYWDYTAGAVDSGPANGVMIISGTVGTTFTVELTAHLEYSGELVGCLATPTPMDGLGTMHAEQIAHAAKMDHAANPDKHPADCVADAATNAGLNAAGGALNTLSKSDNPYLATAGTVGGQLLKLSSPLIKQGGRQLAQKGMKFLFK